ncbi:hypothetical protein P692DRAFT_20838708 [Suillus brevipes Sb2]|nr:hypothetical protein P692DRAFT_20838708 [Suillus brevipes Sb2]
MRRTLIALSLAPIVDVSASMSRPRQQLDEDNDQGSTNTDTITTEGPTHHSQRSLLELLSQLWSLQCQAMIHYNRGDFD